MESKQLLTENKLSRLLAWCSRENKINVIDLQTTHRHSIFNGVPLKKKNVRNPICTHVREIPNTSLLVSLHHCTYTSANMEIFDISKKAQAKKVFSFEEIHGVTGQGDLTYNPRRNILAALSVGGKIAYNLLSVEASPSKIEATAAKLCRKTKWHSQFNTSEKNSISGLDFDPNGEVIATIDSHGVCLLSDANTNNYKSHLEMTMSTRFFDDFSRCRWSTNAGEPLLFIKYSGKQLNIFDAEKRILLMKTPIELEKQFDTLSVDACQSDGNLLVSGGGDKVIKVFDRRELKIVKIFDVSHTEWINCVRLNLSGEFIASAAGDKKVKLVDFKAEKVIYTGSTSDQNTAKSVCFLNYN